MELKDELKLYHNSLRKILEAMDPNKVLRTVDLHRMVEVAWMEVEADREIRYGDWLKRKGLDKILEAGNAIEPR